MYLKASYEATINNRANTGAHFLKVQLHCGLVTQLEVGAMPLVAWLPLIENGAALRRHSE